MDVLIFLVGFSELQKTGQLVKSAILPHPFEINDLAIGSPDAIEGVVFQRGVKRYYKAFKFFLGQLVSLAFGEQVEEYLFKRVKDLVFLFENFLPFLPVQYFSNGCQSIAEIEFRIQDIELVGEANVIVKKGGLVIG